jgi:imidazolonepropionase-like amidohydrolase
MCIRLLFLLVVAGPVLAADLTITNVRLLGTTYTTTIRIEAGLIVAIGESAPEAGAVLDVAGATVLPGLIDSHVHLQSVPGAVFRQDDAQARRDLLHRHLRGYLASGVTTVLDTAIAAEALREVRTYLEDGGPGPSVLALGPVFHNPGGYLDGGSLSDYWGPRWRASGSREDVLDLFEEYAEIDGIVGTKVAIAYGFGGPFDVWDTHTPILRKLIAQENASRGASMYVHATEERTVDIALDMGVHAFAHMIYEMPSEPLIERMRESGAYVITTIAVLDSFATRDDQRRLDTPLVRLTVPDVERETARDADAWNGFLTTFMQTAYPWLPEFLARWIGSAFFTLETVEDELDDQFEILMALHGSGIPIVVGTDSGSWPHFLNLFHGPTTVREMTLLVRAGMDPEDVIASATRIPAEMLGISAEVGTVEVGKRADLIVVSGDPLANISALEELDWVIQGGVAKRPTEWMMR